MQKSTNFPVDYDSDFWKQWTLKELDYQMAPIYWIGNKDKRETYDRHVKTSTNETAIARREIPCQLNISYGENERKKFDVYGTDLGPNSPTFFWVHGGYWRAGDLNWSAPHSRMLYSLGVRSVIISYPLAPAARIEEMSNAICEGLEKAMQLYPESTFIVGGHSAGGQLILTLFHEIEGVKPLNRILKNRVAGAFIASAAFDMRPITKLPTINKALQMKEEQVKGYSAILTIDKIHKGWLDKRNSFEWMILNGEKDPPSMQRFAAIYADLLRKLKFYSEHSILPGDDHFTIVDNLVNPNSNVSRALKNFILRIDNKTKRAKL